MNDRFQAIRDALAMGPTPGPRKAVEQSVIGPHDLRILHASVTFSVGVNGSHSVPIEEAIANAALAAACDPDTIRELLRQLDEMAKALEPFAAVAEHDIGDDETDSDIFIPISKRNARAKPITVGDMRKARAAITSAPQCCVCGKTGLSTVEGDGGGECQLSDGRWTCSFECWERATESASPSHS